MEKKVLGQSVKLDFDFTSRSFTLVAIWTVFQRRRELLYFTRSSVYRHKYTSEGMREKDKAEDKTQEREREREGIEG